MGIKDLFKREKESQPQYIGYTNNSKIGIRGNNFVISLSECANEISAQISRTDSVFTFIEYANEITSALPAIVSHPNTASAFLLSYGCEAKSSREFAVELRELNPNIEFLELENGLISEFAMTIGPAVLQELKFQASPGLAEIPSPMIAVIAEARDERVSELIDALSKAQIDVHEFIGASNSGDALHKAAEAGALAIVNFTQRNQYPSGTHISPTINIESGSEFHQKFAADFDLGVTATANKILQSVQVTIGRSPTASEIAQCCEAYGEQATSIGLRVLNPILSNFARDLAENISTAQLKIAIATGSEVNNIAQSQREGYEIFTISDHGSLFGLAEALTKKLQ
jgi:hypothetical protein